MDKYEDLLERAIDQLPPERCCRRLEQRSTTFIEILDERIRYCRKH